LSDGERAELSRFDMARQFGLFLSIEAAETGVKIISMDSEIVEWRTGNCDNLRF
jgi:hypothetical protein